MSPESGASPRRVRSTIIKSLGLLVLTSGFLLLSTLPAQGLVDGLTGGVEATTSLLPQSDIEVEIGDPEASLIPEETQIGLGETTLSVTVGDTEAQVALGETGLTLDETGTTLDLGDAADSIAVETSIIEDAIEETTSPLPVKAPAPPNVTKGGMVVEPTDPPGVVAATGSTQIPSTSPMIDEGSTSGIFSPERVREPSAQGPHLITYAPDRSNWLSDLLRFSTELRFALTDAWAGSSPLTTIAVLALIAFVVADLSRRLALSRIPRPDSLVLSGIDLPG